jgi:hypothetical protein
VIALKSPGDSIDFAIAWDNLGAATLSTVTHTVPTGITKVSETNDTTTSTVRLSGATHGSLYNITGTATLSTGRTLERSFPLRVMAGIG